MRASGRTVGKVLLSVLLGLLSFPMLGYGGYLLVCWARIHSSNVYYVDYPYPTAALVWFAVGFLNLYITLRAVWRRSFYGILFVIPVLVFLAVTAIEPDHMPGVSGLMADTNYLSVMRSSLVRWNEDNHRFPASEAEFKSAVRCAHVSRYRQRGNPLPYEVVVVLGADGPRLTDVSARPGVVYYCVSKDLQQFWVTMTRLQSDVAATAHLESALGLPQEFWVVHAVGRDYLTRKQ